LPLSSLSRIYLDSSIDCSYMKQDKGLRSVSCFLLILMD